MLIFGRPFAGAFPIGNFFDHDKPIDGDANGYVLTLCGARDTKQVDGHPGYDWRMPEGTPLFAAADAVVLTAGLEPPHFCPQLNRTVQALRVQLAHTAPTGEFYVSVYGHLSRVDVQEGVSISEGTVIGLSGNTRLQRHTASALRRRAERHRPLCPDRSLRVASSDGGSMGGRPARRGERVALERRSGSISPITLPIASEDTQAGFSRHVKTASFS